MIYYPEIQQAKQLEDISLINVQVMCYENACAVKPKCINKINVCATNKH